MSDRRLLKSNGRVADISLRGEVTAERFVEARFMRVARPVLPIFDSVEPGYWRRERELVMHEGFYVLEDGDGWVFGYAARDGYVGYVDQRGLGTGDVITPTHVVNTRLSYLTPEPELKNNNEMVPVSFGTALEVFATHEKGRWAEVTELRSEPDGHKTTYTSYTPKAHLQPLSENERDPVAVAGRFLSTPYHWGGNSGFGIDCSGLVQAGCLACGIPCPGDSDLQEAVLGVTLPEDENLRRGDLLFWKGHVAWVAGDNLLLHANAHHMAVAYEPLDQAIARIKDQGDGEVTRRARLESAK